jgi:hypothetical protein
MSSLIIIKFTLSFLFHIPALKRSAGITTDIEVPTLTKDLLAPLFLNMANNSLGTSMLFDL